MGVVLVGMADMKIAKCPDKITTIGLGSCIGVVLFDKTRKIAGMLHFMLPRIGESGDNNKAKFADSGIPALISSMERLGANKRMMVAKMAGGAHMFGSISSANDILKVGSRNAIACKEILQRLGIPVLAEDTGGKYGRTIEFNPENGSLKIKIVGRGEHVI